MVATGNGESGFDSGEGAWEIATNSKDRHEEVVTKNNNIELII